MFKISTLSCCQMNISAQQHNSISLIFWGHIIAVVLYVCTIGTRLKLSSIPIINHVILK